jgi:hypothetical protein
MRRVKQRSPKLSLRNAGDQRLLLPNLTIRIRVRDIT